MILTLLGWALFGLVVGAIARLLIPGRQPLGLLGTMALGVVGSFAGGFLAFLFTGGDAIQSSGWVGSIIGGVIVLGIIVYMGRKDQRITHRA